MENSSARLDVLLYAHDGRGFGHASRSVAIGMALRRLFPHLSVLLVTGCRFSTELIAGAPLDWLKLPSYATRVVAGRSIGITGLSMFSDRQLADLRAAELAHLVKLYRPRLVLVDHTPQGKHRELLPALAAAGSETRWLLGVRGVLGEVRQARSDLARQLFADHYHGLLWYGDSRVLGPEHCRQLAEQYRCRPVECGYVIRLAELAHWRGTPPSPREGSAGVISVPWIGEKTLPFFRALAEAVGRIPTSWGNWRVFLEDPRGEVAQLFGDTVNCRLEAIGGHYAEALLQAGILVTYGGYNSLMDVLHARIPALVVLREMSDAEQQIHLASLARATGKLFTTISEAAPSADQLEAILLERLQSGRQQAPSPLDTNGATATAGYLHKLLLSFS